MSKYFTHKKPYHPASLVPKGECFAISKGRKLGIFFTRQQMLDHTQGYPGRTVKSFAGVAEAKSYLAQQGLAPMQASASNGWITTNQEPILYQHSFPLFHKGGGATNASNISPKPGAKRPLPDGSSSSSGYASTATTPHQSSQSAKSIVSTYSSSKEEQPNGNNKPSAAAQKRQKKAPEEDVIDLQSDTDDESDGDDEDKKPEAENDDVKFDKIQQQAIDAAFTGSNVFITGVAGTGKSAVTQKIVNDAKGMRKEVAVAAPTGVAAVNLGPDLAAQTVHSLAGCGVPQAARDFDKIMARWNLKKWKSIEMLVLDEIGMLSADYLDWLDVYVRKARRRPLEPFGGIQLVFVGDFAQLGPIPGRLSLSNQPFRPSEDQADCLLNIKETAAYAFQTVLFREADFHYVHLKKVYRQNNPEFVSALMDIREANPNTHLVQSMIETCSAPLEDRQQLEIPDGIKPTILYCTNRNVDKENYDNLIKLSPTSAKTFKATDSVHVSTANVAGGARDVVERNLTKSSFFNDCTASKVIEIRIGAQVMLLQNLDMNKGLVNGSRGVVEKFGLVPIVKDQVNGEERLIGPDDKEKYPGVRFEDIKYNQRMEFDGKIWRVCRFEKYPFVRFVNNQTRIITPVEFERNQFRQGRVVRSQIPLRLAWALTIHKAQGATLDYVVVDLQGCFTSGQVYVALSRARTMLGLQIKNFNPRHVKIDQLVAGFYDALDKKCIKNFLENEAGIWWFPLLNSPGWLNMFRNASHRNARENSRQFRDWESEYTPHEGYRGWGHQQV